MDKQSTSDENQPKRSLKDGLKRVLHAGHFSGYPESNLTHQAIAQNGDAPPVQKICIDYGPDNLQEQNIEDVEAFFAAPRPAWSKVRWIRVIGTPDANFLNALGNRHHFHPLALEDLIQIPQRPKVDKYTEDPNHSYLAVIASSPALINQRLTSQQVAIFASKTLVVSFQEYGEDTFDRIQERLKIEKSHLRKGGGDFLLYCILDKIVDQLFPILDQMGDQLESLDEAVLESPSTKHMVNIHDAKREMMLLRREIWPMREMLLSLKSLHSESDKIISAETSIYLRDVYDHCIHVADMLETYRDAITAILDIHMNMMSNRMNEVMKVLTIIATIFIPLSFLSGVFGMNFTTSLPGQNDPWSFTIFALACGTLGLGMLGLFWWRKWL